MEIGIVILDFLNKNDVIKGAWCSHDNQILYLLYLKKAFVQVDQVFEIYLVYSPYQKVKCTFHPKL